MKQMITRLDDELHARLKARATAEERSVNDLVTAVLVGALEGRATRRAVRERARASGRLVVPEPARDASCRDDVIAETRGSGDAVSAELAAERADG